MTPYLHITGTCDRRLFGINPAERLRRQRGDLPGPTLVADASAVLGDSAIAWLIENPGTAVLTEAGRPVAIAVDVSNADSAASAISSADPSLTGITPSQVGDVFIRKLRRRDRLFVRSLDEDSVGKVEKQLFDSVYKGITDLVTKYVWPLPAFWVTKLCARLHVHPNVVTIIGILSMITAAVLWFRGDIVAGLGFAWFMTFLDTVDGKLARVTATASKLGNSLDHVTDVIHPPIWWLALAIGLASGADRQGSTLVWQACVVVLVGYVVGRIVETLFKRRFRYNSYLWRPFDSAFRLIVSRRNIILLIVTVGLLLGAPVQAFVAAAAWTLVSVAIQILRFAQALYAGRRGPLPSWLM
jgi:phosphatidylglycerophosphate synthase